MEWAVGFWGWMSVKGYGFLLSKWQYYVAVDDCDKMTWEGIQFIGKRLEGSRARMQGWEKAYGRFRLNERRAHGLCFLTAN